ncbi:four helix bundle protein [Patescibacteria group bacterium]|nr:four helix bundle protein [Patescibacteria group bacterium]
MRSYRDLLVWKKSMKLVIAIYRMTKYFPKSEIYGLTSQIRRCAVSIPSNIAEGRSRGSTKEFKKFIQISFGSGAELETQLQIAQYLKYGQIKHYSYINKLLSEIMKMLNSLILSLKPYC